MNTEHIVSRFAAPVFFYLALVLYFIAGLSILGTVTDSPSFLILGLIMFILGYNSWYVGKVLRGG